MTSAATDTSVETATPASSESPGQLVRRARERAGMTPEDLSSQIKLSKSTLDALERDDFAHLGQPVYVRGYYRKCARVLPLAEQDLIAAYEALVKPAAPVAPQRIPLAGGVASGTATGQNRQIVVAAIALGAILGLGYWYSVSEPVARPAPVAAATKQAPESSQPAAEPVAEAPAAESNAEPTEPVAAVPPPAPPNQLSLQFLEASWARVEDGRNKTLLIGLVRAGETQLLNGELPYTVFIGNSRKVRAEFKGQPFDFARHIQANDTARFTVP